MSWAVPGEPGAADAMEGRFSDPKRPWKRHTDGPCPPPAPPPRPARGEHPEEGLCRGPTGARAGGREPPVRRGWPWEGSWPWGPQPPCCSCPEGCTWGPPPLARHPTLTLRNPCLPRCGAAGRVWAAPRTSGGPGRALVSCVQLPVPSLQLTRSPFRAKKEPAVSHCPTAPHQDALRGRPQATRPGGPSSCHCPPHFEGEGARPPSTSSAQRERQPRCKAPLPACPREPQDWETGLASGFAPS